MEYIARKFIRDVDRKCKAKFRVDENIGWLDKIRQILLRHRLVKSLVEYFDFSGRISRDRGSRGRAS